ncbi:signal peptide peptidase SppA [Sphingomicrobium clamense]|uniref:Signal peptide peptidase SppA n=1 Tax=Sphingomicrobium clamense TaxID=2851013 RepID=A0ABS6V5H3_9SPHN|nr:signal peptide peptidase SppA [Sphingomicrobium sp. B8]MBW0144442.1 signal peptide peptidase SppA [Sphingomicrobium sp. B8]
MSFARWAWKLLVGIKDAMVLVFMILFFTLLYAVLKGAPDPVHAGILHVDLDGVIVEEAAEVDPFTALTGGVMQEFERRDLVAALRAAAEDDRVEGVALDLDGFLGGGQVAIQDVADALQEVRDAGKSVTAYAIGYSDDAYQLAVHADEIWLDPMGGVAFAGPGGSNLYFAEAMDRFGITANIYRAGDNDYKSAVEPYQRADMSPEARENAQQLAGAIFENWLDAVERARPEADVRAYAADPVAALDAADGDLAEASLAAGLVDKLAPRREWHAMLAELGGTSEKNPDGYKVIPLRDYIADKVDNDVTADIAVVTVAGTIVDGSAPVGSAAGTDIANLIDDAVDDGIEALVIRVDSPGGSALASERIRQAVLRAKDADIPVVASFGNVAASGGYWVALAADEIMAEPASITGSIGVFGIFPSFEGTLDQLGIGVDGVKTTPLSGEPDILGGPSDAADRLVQAGVDQTYVRFLALTAANRDMEVASVRDLAGGRVYDGGTARQLGLIDSFGGIDDAIARAAELAELEGEDHDVRWLERGSDLPPFLRGLMASEEVEGASAYAWMGGSSEARLMAAVREARGLLQTRGVQARCLACPTDLKQTRAETGGWRGFVEALLD